MAIWIIVKVQILFNAYFVAPYFTYIVLFPPSIFSPFSGLLCTCDLCIYYSIMPKGQGVKPKCIRVSDRICGYRVLTICILFESEHGQWKCPMFVSFN